MYLSKKEDVASARLKAKPVVVLKDKPAAEAEAPPITAALGLDTFRNDFDNIFSKRFELSVSEAHSTLDHQTFQKISKIEKQEKKNVSRHDYIKYNKDLREKVVTDHNYGRYSSTKLVEAALLRNMMPVPKKDFKNAEPKESNVRITCFRMGSFFGVPRTRQLEYTCEKIDLQTSMRDQKVPESKALRDLKYHENFLRKQRLQFVPCGSNFGHLENP